VLRACDGYHHATVTATRPAHAGNPTARELASVLAEITRALDYPMFVVTARAGEQGEHLAGCLVGFASQCSIDPPRFMIWISKQNRTFRVALEAVTLAVHLLAADQKDLAELFGGTTGDEDDKFSCCRWHAGPGGTAILDDCAGWFVGVVLARHDGGDHVGFLVQPTHAHAAAHDDWPGQLGFQMVRDINPGHPA
jgi:flavin reductase (DIM6/NTAB) family NADH-FMN oxidoreductase RutF